MDAAPTFAPTQETTARPPKSERANERRCLATGEVLPKAALLRFVVGPGQLLVPDLAQTLPGRGLWVTAEPEALALALRKNLFAKSAKEPVKIPPDMVAQLALLLRKRCLDLLGFARRAGIAVLGQPQVEAALKARKLGLLLLADDASQHLPDYTAVPVLKLFTRDELGAALGHEQLVYVGLKPHSLTLKLHDEAQRLGKFTKQPHIDSQTDSRTE